MSYFKSRDSKESPNKTVRYFKIILLFFIASFCINATGFNTNFDFNGTSKSEGKVVAKFKSKKMPVYMESEDSVVKSYLAFDLVGGTFPCGARMGISLQDTSRYIFSSASAFNATLMPDTEHDIYYPDSGPGKTSNTAREYTESYKRVKNLKVGQVNSSFGKRWAVYGKQLREDYPENVDDVVIGGKTRTAFETSNLFYEMLISIQTLSKENENLNERVNAMEERLNTLEQGYIGKPGGSVGKVGLEEISVYPNPSVNGLVNIKYNNFSNAEHAELIISDLNGKLVNKIDLIAGQQEKQLNLTAGVYFYQLLSDGKPGASQKIIIQ